MTTELVVLTDDSGTAIGSMAKSAVHTTQTPLHLAFSCYVFNGDGQVLVTRRSLTKTAWPGVWTNSFCGHPFPGEPITDSIRRRGKFELGIDIGEVVPVDPKFRYRAVDPSGIVENEVCPVYVTTCDANPEANPIEVADWDWADPADLIRSATATPWAFSPWMVLQLASGTGKWLAMLNKHRDAK